MTTHIHIDAWMYVFISHGNVPSGNDTGTAVSQKKSVLNCGTASVCHSSLTIYIPVPQFLCLLWYQSIFYLELVSVTFQVLFLNFHIYWHETLHYIPLFYSVETVRCSPWHDTSWASSSVSLAVHKTYTDTDLFIPNTGLFLFCSFLTTSSFPLYPLYLANCSHFCDRCLLRTSELLPISKICI